MTIRLGTRGSQLALAQAHFTRASLEERGHDVEIVVISTVGDRVTDRPFAQIGPAGVFVREIERALLDDEIDLAVHSYKDLPTASPDGLTIAAVPQRVDPADVVVINGNAYDPDAPQLPLVQGARVGTSSSRRSALLMHARPDLVIAGIRGNVPTRLQKCAAEYDATILAAAGLSRLEAEGVDFPQGQRHVRLDPRVFVPAPSQGALGLQTRAEGPARDAVAALDDPTLRAACDAERAVLSALEGGCDAAIGAWATPSQDRWELFAFAERGDRLVRAHGVGVLDTITKGVIAELLA